MTLRIPSIVAALALFPACDVTSTVGYNDSALLEERCSPESTLARCSSDACAVAELGPALVGSGAIAVDDEHVFFQRTLTTLTKIPVLGGQSVDLVSDVDRLVNVALDADFVYWIETEHAVHRVPKAGGPVELLVDPPGHPTSLALDGTSVYVTLTTENQLLVVPKRGGEPSFFPDQAAPVSIATDATHVYWLNQGLSENSGQLMRAALGNLNDVETLLSNLDAPIALALARDAIFFAAGTRAFKLDKAGGTALEILDGFDEPKALAAFEDTLYVAGGWGLARVNPSATTRLLVPPRSTLGVALGCQGVFATGWFIPVLLKYGR
ncbi:MAG TPA: hypothetical protein VK524_34195 [Polyangiaceae bacterium]|nr:hypothetical protein [Polyangiaceae bacterium]